LTHKVFILQVLEKLWNICRCGPYHVLKEYLFIKKRKWKITCGIEKMLKIQGYRGFTASWRQKTLRCRKDEEDED